MRGGARNTTIIVLSVAVGLGCAFDTGGTEIDDAELDADAGSTGSVAGTEGPSTAGSAGMSGGSDPDPGSTSGPGGTGDGSSTDDDQPPPTTQGTAQAVLAFVEGGAIDLGERALDGPDVIVLSLENTGDAAADIVGGGTPPEPLLWATGEFPGPGGNCGGLLPPGGACLVELAVGPGMPGVASGSLAVEYDDGVQLRDASTMVSLVATGVGPNLIANPDAEADPVGNSISGWEQTSGDFEVDDEHSHGGGSVSFFAGSSSNSALTQDIDLSGYDESVDGLPMTFEFQGWSRSNGWFNDPHDIELQFYDAGSTELARHDRANMDHTSWESTNFTVPIPTGTRRARITLSCDRNWGSNCSAWFDDFNGVLRYPAP